MAEPGSFVKTYSAAAAWLEFGSDSTLTTPVKALGEVADGTLNGRPDPRRPGRSHDGRAHEARRHRRHHEPRPQRRQPDPRATLTPEDPLTGLNDLAEQVKASGIDAVSGDVIVDDRLFEGELARARHTDRHQPEHHRRADHAGRCGGRPRHGRADPRGRAVDARQSTSRRSKPAARPRLADPSRPATGS